MAYPFGALAPAALPALPPPVLLSARIPFQGFYGSIWDDAIDSEVAQWLDYYAEDRGLFDRDFPDLAHIPDHLIQWGNAFEDVWDAVDYSAVKAALAKEYASEFAAWLADGLGLDDLAFEFEEMTSPAFYNFETDRLFAKLSLTLFETIRQRLAEEAPDKLADTYRELFTSYDGFASFYDNSIPAKPLAEWDHNELYALLVAWVGHSLGDQRSIDDELFIGGLYEEVYRAVDAATDWSKVRETVARNVLDRLTDEEREELELRPRRCPATLELPLS